MLSAAVLDHYRLRCSGCGEVEVRHSSHPPLWPPDATGQQALWPSETWAVERKGCERCAGPLLAPPDLL